jgi:ABC-2 type transport system permease protein
MHALGLYLRYMSVSVRSQMQYRASFLMMSVGHLTVTAVEIVGIWALFERFGDLKGWSLPEVALCYSLVNIAFALAEGMGRGFDTFHRQVRSGGFDRILLRPRSAALQVAGQRFLLTRIGRLVQGLAVLVWAVWSLEIPWSLGHTALVFWAIVGGTCLFYGILVLQATSAFWTIEGLEAWNTITYGGIETAQYPLSIYRSWFRKFFTFVVPLACVTYYPALAILGRADPVTGSGRAFQVAAPGSGLIVLALSLGIWRLGVRRYHSTGS